MTRNVTKEHIVEIFSTYGNIKLVDFPIDKMHPNHGKGFAYVEFETADEAENAMKHMDGGEFYLFYNFFLHFIEISKVFVLVIVEDNFLFLPVK